MADLEESVARFQAGEKEAFDALVSATERLVLRIAILSLGEEALALDAAQETFLAAYRALKRWRSGGSFRTWLARTALNKAREIARSRRTAERARARHRRPSAGGATPSDAAEAAERKDLVRAVLAALPPREREVVILRHYEGLPFREIAEVLGIAEGTARATLHQALANLRSKLSGHEL